jgi:hypothetical protein
LGQISKAGRGSKVSGLGATLALSTFVYSNIDLDNWYTGAASDLSYFCLTARVDLMLTNEHWDWFLAIVYFLPELLAAASVACSPPVSSGVSEARRSEPAVRH